MNVLDLFSGIGGFSLGLERAGMRTRAFCEIDPYCRAVLRQHWPDVPVYDDVRTLTAARLVADADTDRNGAILQTHSPIRQSEGCNIDLICGGFPCQDISTAGKGAGITGARSGLWSEYARIVGEVRPRYVIVENVAALLGRGIERVLGDLAALGYDAEWHCIPASAVGAPHRRDRVWIVAYPRGAERGPLSGACERLAGTDGLPQRNQGSSGLEPGREDVADANNTGRIEQWRPLPISESYYAAQCNGWWLTEPDVGRVAHGIPARVDRLRSLGNALVPQIAEWIGRRILEWERVSA